MTIEQAAVRIQIIRAELQVETNKEGLTLAELDSLFEIYDKEMQELCLTINANHPAPPPPRRRPA